MTKVVVLGLIIFILSEVLCVIALFSSDWLVSDHLGKAVALVASFLTTPPLFMNSLWCQAIPELD